MEFSDKLPISEYNTQPFYSFNGRIGRIRYLAYSSSILMFLTMIGIIFAIVGEAFSKSGNAILLISFNFCIAIIYVYINCITVKRRLNDIGYTGWFGLLFLIPGINLLIAIALIFSRGDESFNKYGTPAAPPERIHYILAFSPIALMILGILFTLFIPMIGRQ